MKDIPLTKKTLEGPKKNQKSTPKDQHRMGSHR